MITKTDFEQTGSSRYIDRLRGSQDTLRFLKHDIAISGTDLFQGFGNEYHDQRGWNDSSEFTYYVNG